MQSKSNRTLVWKDVKGFEGIYKISNSGLIYSYPFFVYNYKRDGKLLFNGQRQNTKNNNMIDLFVENKRITVGLPYLIAKHFVENPNNYEHIHFKDGDLSHIFAENLEWVPEEFDSAYQGKTLYKMDFYGNIVDIYSSFKSACEAINATGCYSQKHLRGGRTTYKGYIWMYEDDFFKKEKKKN